MSAAASPVANADDTLEWSDELVLDVARMDSTHQEFVELYQALRTAAAEDRIACLDAFIAHSEAHFGQEDRWMEIVGFTGGCHQAEHARVLEVLREIRGLLAQGDSFYFMQLLREIPAWFRTHSSGMDAALALLLTERGFDFDTETLPSPADGEAKKVFGGCSFSA